MPNFDVVVAVDRSWGIGKANGLPWPKLRGDLAHFKRITTHATEGHHNAIVMGRKTWESIGSKPLAYRRNLVISRGAVAMPEGHAAVHSLDEALGAVGDAESTFVVGGAEIYRIAFEHPALRWVYLTRVDGAFECDTHIPDLDARGFVADPAWAGACVSEDNNVRFRIERLSKAR